MITVIGANEKRFFLKDGSQAIVLEPRVYHDSAILGYSLEEDRFMYSKQQFLEQLAEQGMTYEEAIEYYHYNTIGTYAKNYPVFLDTEDELIETFDDYEVQYNPSEWIKGE